MDAQAIFDQLLAARGFATEAEKQQFLAPDYEATKHDPFLLPDMEAAIARLIIARDRAEKVVIYGDYDIDGLTATTLLLDAFPKFGIEVSAYIPNRFVEGYGLSMGAIEKLAEQGAELVVTVDCGSLSHAEIARANELGMDIIVTDHHNVAPEMPPAIATINPKRPNHSYPFIDLAGVGVAFKLVQAMQQRMEGLPDGQEKWLLDLVAFGTVCDVVSLVDENRVNVFWGLKVMQKTRRPGIKALATVAGIEIPQVNARHLGYVLGPHLNAAGRLETAMRSLDVLRAENTKIGLDAAQILREMNIARRTEQDRIFAAAKEQALEFADYPVLVLSGADWSHGVIGIVAAKILETYRKPTYILQEMGEEAKGSARSYGDFSAADAIRAAEMHIIKGGGHKLAAGVTLKTENIAAFREAVNDFYRSQKLQNQLEHLEPKADIQLNMLQGISEELIELLDAFEPYGNQNPQPIFHFTDMHVAARREMGAEKQHVKLTIADEDGRMLELIAFNKAAEFTQQPGDAVEVWAQLEINEWNDRRSVQGKLLKAVNA